MAVQSQQNQADQDEKAQETLHQEEVPSAGSVLQVVVHAVSKGVLLWGVAELPAGLVDLEGVCAGKKIHLLGRTKSCAT